MWNANSLLDSPSMTALAPPPTNSAPSSGLNSIANTAQNFSSSQLDLQYVPQSQSQFETSAHVLISHILDLGTVNLDPKMIDFLNTPGVLPIFLSYMTRIPDTQPLVPLDSDWSIDPRIYRARDLDLDCTISSYRVMEILDSTNSFNADFVEKNLNQMLYLLFDILALNSDGNLFHFAAVVDSLMRRSNPCLPILDLLLFVPPEYSPIPSTDSVPLFPLFLRLLRYIHVPPILNLVIQCFFQAKFGYPNRTELFNRFQEIQVMEFLLTNVSVDHEPLVLSTVDLFNFLIDDILRLEGSATLFLSLTTDKHMISGLIALFDSPHDYHRNAVISILNALAVKSIPKPLSCSAAPLSTQASFAVTLSKTVTSFLFSYMPQLSQYLRSCEIGSMQLQGLELIQTIVIVSLKDQVETVAEPELWHTLCDLALVHHPTSLFLSCYYRVVRTVVRDGSATLIQHALVSPRLISRLIHFYLQGDAAVSESEAASVQLARLCEHQVPSSPHDAHRLITSVSESPPMNARSDLHAFAVLVLNFVRLAADSFGPDHCLHSLLASLPDYQAFLPLLRNRTQLQILSASLKESVSTVQMPKWPPPQYSPDLVLVEFADNKSPSFSWQCDPPSQSSYSSCTASNGIPVVKLTVEQEFGMDLGSKFAICLGFDPVPSTPGNGSSSHSEMADVVSSPKRTNYAQRFCEEYAREALASSCSSDMDLDEPCLESFPSIPTVTAGSSHVNGMHNNENNMVLLQCGPSFDKNGNLVNNSFCDPDMQPCAAPGDLDDNMDVS